MLVSLLELVAAVTSESPGNQEAFIAASGMRHLNQLLTQLVATAAASGGAGVGKPLAAVGLPTRPLGAAAAAAPTIPAALPPAVRVMACLVRGAASAQLLLMGSPLLSQLITLSEPEPTGPLALSEWVAVGSHPGCKLLFRCNVCACTFVFTSSTRLRLWFSTHPSIRPAVHPSII